MLNHHTLRIALAQKNLTLKEVARLAGLDLLRLYRLSSKNVRPKPEEVDVLASILGVEPTELEREECAHGGVGAARGAP